MLCFLFFLDDPANGPINPILVVPFDGVVAQRVKVSIDAGQGDCIFLNLQGVEVFSQCLESQDSCYATPSDTHRPCYANRPMTFNV